MKTVIFHSADFDGLFCREIARKFLGDEGVTYIGWNFGDKPLDIPSEGTIYVMDLPVDRVFGFNYAEPDTKFPPGLDWCVILDRLVWIDHHATSIMSHPRDIPGYRIDGVAACRLAWQWFSHRPSGRLPAKIDFYVRCVDEPRAVQLVGEADVWDKRNPEAEWLQHGLKAVEPENWGHIFDTRDFARHATSALVQRGQLIHEYVVNQNAVTMKRTEHHRKWRGLNFLFANLAIGNADTFKSAITDETDALLMWRHDGRKVCVSLYGVPGHPEHDLSAIAKSLGGGGHKQACGFEIGLSDFITTIIYADEFDNATTV